MANGWIKLHRCLLDKAIWKCSTPEQKVILVTLLLMANHDEQQWIWEGKKYVCKPGQFITSLKSIAEKSDCSIKNVRTALTKFENLEFLVNQSAKKNRLITIVNWELYQANDNEGGNQTGKQTGKEVANNWQSGGKEVATNKNDKNVKNDKNARNKKEIFYAPTVQEIKAYCIERGNNVDAETFFNFYESKGWMVGRNKMKDWKAAVRTWEQNRSGAKKQSTAEMLDDFYEMSKSWAEESMMKEAMQNESNGNDENSFGY